MRKNALAHQGKPVRPLPFSPPSFACAKAAPRKANSLCPYLYLSLIGFGWEKFAQALDSHDVARPAKLLKSPENVRGMPR